MSLGRSWVATVDVGATFMQSFFYFEGERVFPLTGWGATFRFRDASSRVLVEVRSDTPGSSSIAVDGALAKIFLSLSGRDSLSLSGPRGFYELEIFNGGTTLRILDGVALYRQPGRGSIDSVNVVIRRDTRSVTVERGVVDQLRIVDRGPPGTSGAPGPAGANGTQGADGAPGTGIEPHDGKTVTVSTAAVTLMAFSVTTSKTFTAEVTVQARTTEKVRTQKWMANGVVDGAGVVVLDKPVLVSADNFDLGIVSFSVTAANSVNILFTPYSATSTSIFVQQLTLATGT